MKVVQARYAQSRKVVKFTMEFYPHLLVLYIMVQVVATANMSAFVSGLFLVLIKAILMK